MTSLSSSVRLYFSLFLLTLTTEKINVTKTVPSPSFLSLDSFILSISLVFLTMFAHIGYRNNYRSTFFWHLTSDFDLRPLDAIKEAGAETLYPTLKVGEQVQKCVHLAWHCGAQLTMPCV